MFILASTLIYHDWYNNCCSDVANIGMVIEVFSTHYTMIYDTRGMNTESIIMRPRYPLVSKGTLSQRRVRLSHQERPWSSTLPCSGFSTW